MHKNERALLSIITILTNDMTRFTMDIVTKRAEERVTFTYVQWVEVALFLSAGRLFPVLHSGSVVRRQRRRALLQ